MATSKTLTPTNVTISIPAMTDVPDASVFSNCVDKLADAINTIPRIYKAERTVNTGAYGRFQSGLYYANGNHILSVYAKTPNDAGLIFLSASLYNNSQYWIEAHTQDGSPLLNTEITVVILYTSNAISDS